MDKQAIQRIADADATRFGIQDNPLAHLQIALGIEISIHHTSSRLDDRHTSIVAHEVNQPAPATRNANIDIPHSAEHLSRGLMSGREQGDDILQ